MEFKVLLIITIITRLCTVFAFKNPVFKNLANNRNRRNDFSNHRMYSPSMYITAVELISNYSTKDFVYDFNKAIPTKAGNNTINQLSVSQFPTLNKMGISYTLFELAPCGSNLPHVHPRASELLYVISAENLQLGFIEENSDRLNKAHINNLTDGKVAIFPQGYIHYELNLGCKPAKFLSALNHEDPGVITISTRGFELPDIALQSTYILSEAEVKAIRSKLPSSPAVGIAECLKRCSASSKLLSQISLLFSILIFIRFIVTI